MVGMDTQNNQDSGIKEAHSDLVNSIGQKSVLPAFKVIYEDGSSYVTSMAAETTEADAKAYFIGQSFEQRDGRMLKAVEVIQQTEWKPVTYGDIGGDVCRIHAWDDGVHFTLSPVSFGQPHIGLREGEFHRYNEFDNEATREMLGDPIDNAVWKD